MITVALSCRKLPSAGTLRSSVYFLKFTRCVCLIPLFFTVVTAFLCYIPTSVKWRIRFPMFRFLSHKSLYFFIASSLWAMNMFLSNYSHLLENKRLSLQRFVSLNGKSLTLQCFKSLSHQEFISPVLGPLSHQEFNCPVLQFFRVTKNLIVHCFMSLKSPRI